MNATSFQTDLITWYCQMAGQQGAYLELTMDPSVDVASIPDSQYLALAQKMRVCNTKYGTPVLLRFGHEMNGNWMVYYGQRPGAYIQAFTTLATYVHAQTNMTAMLWSPNTGSGYPYGGPQAAGFPDPGSADFQAMDTNGDGVVSSSDDVHSFFYYVLKL